MTKITPPTYTLNFDAQKPCDEHLDNQAEAGMDELMDEDQK